MLSKVYRQDFCAFFRLLLAAGLNEDNCSLWLSEINQKYGSREHEILCLFSMVDRVPIPHRPVALCILDFISNTQRVFKRLYFMPDASSGCKSNVPYISLIKMSRLYFEIGKVNKSFVMGL
jgi:hypothetical protein